MALPALEAMTGTAHAGADIPKRYFVGFAGTSTGFPFVGYDLLKPDAMGPGYDVKRALAPIADLEIRDNVSVVTDLEIPWGSDGNIPPGGRRIKWHASSTAPLISGVRSLSSGSQAPAGPIEAADGPTSEVIAADHLGGDTLHPYLNYRIQVAYYRGSNFDGGSRGRITYYRNDDGNIIPVDPVVSPRLAYESLFTGFVPTDPAQAAAALRALRRQRSAVDLVLEETTSLMTRLGAADKQRMNQHLDELRDLERRLDEVAPPTDGSCELLPHPGEDPPLGGALDSNDTNGFEAGGAYSNEETRAELITDMLAMAFTCDLSRSGSIMYSMAQCFMNANPLFGYASDIHQLGHYAAGGGLDGLNAVSDGVAWHVKHWARLVKKLKDTPELDGSSVLDHTALVLLFEGGWGQDPEAGTSSAVHSSENMAALIAGHAGGLNAAGGQHISRPGGHPAQVLNSALRAIGSDHEMGEVSGNIDELFA